MGYRLLKTSSYDFYADKPLDDEVSVCVGMKIYKDSVYIDFGLSYNSVKEILYAYNEYTATMLGIENFAEKDIHFSVLSKVQVEVDTNLVIDSISLKEMKVSAWYKDNPNYKFDSLPSWSEQKYTNGLCAYYIFNTDKRSIHTEGMDKYTIDCLRKFQDWYLKTNNAPKLAKICSKGSLRFRFLRRA